MIKNQSNIYRFPMEDHLGRGVTGLAPTIKLSKDVGAFASSTNSVTEPDTTNAPGLYQLILTAEECNCDLLTLVVNVPTGEWGAILTEFEMQSPSSGITAQDVWNYPGDKNVSNIQTELETYGVAKPGDAMTLTNDYDAAKSAASAAEITEQMSVLMSVLQEILAGIFNWELSNDVLTIYKDGVTTKTYQITRDGQGNIIRVEPSEESDSSSSSTSEAEE